MFNPSELLRYSRHLLLPEFNLAGQQKLKQGSILVIGAGGLGSPALYYLAAAGVGRIGIADFDTVDESNLQRQILYQTQDVGKPKTEIAALRLKQLNPYIEVITHFGPINSQNALGLIENYDVVIDGSDNLPTRYRVNDACIFLGKPLVYGAIFQFEGQVSVFNQLHADGTRGPNYRDLFPEPPPPELVPSCSESGVLGVLPGIIGSLQANEAIKLLSGIGETLSGRLLLFDSLYFTTQMVTLKPNPQNPVSGANPTIRQLIDYEAFCNPAHHKPPPMEEISAKDLKALLQGSDKVLLLDVREPFEVEIASLGGMNIPLNEITERVNDIPRDIPVVVYCKSGQRSANAIKWLTQQHGFSNLMNLKGGILQWIQDVDAQLQKY